MWDAWELSHPQHDNTFDHPELYDFVDISQNNHNDGEKHYQNALKQRARISKKPRPMNNVKIYGGSGRHGTEKHGIECFWRNIFTGCASARFHRPDSGIGINEKARKMLQSARMLLQEFNIFTAEPAPDLLKYSGENVCYLLNDLTGPYVLYFPEKGSAILNNNAKKLNQKIINWLNIEDVCWAKKEEIENINRINLTTPGKGQWAAVIT